MRISELEAREDLSTISAATLSEAFEAELGRPHRVRFGDGPGQRWLEQGLLSAWYTADLCRAGRRFLADGFRFTRVGRRLIPQFALGSALATRVGLLAGGRTAFHVDPPIEDAAMRLILPGNRRIRLFHFGSRLTRVVLKRGFDREAMDTEIRIRANGARGPFPPILRVGEGGSWFEEAIFDGYALSRCPPWLPFERLEMQALDALEGWAAPRRRLLPTGEYVSGLIERLPHDILRVPKNLAERMAADRSDLLVGPSHGDAQAGNVLIDRRGQLALFIDWEFAGRRSRFYDRVVWALRMRWPQGLARRVAAALDRRAGHPALIVLPRPRAERRAALAVALLEDLVWQLRAWNSWAKGEIGRGLPEASLPVADALRRLYR